MDNRQRDSILSESRPSETLSRHTDFADDSPLRDRQDGGGSIELGDMASSVQTAPEPEKQYAEFDPHSGPQVVSVSIGVPPLFAGAGDSAGADRAGGLFGHADDVEEAGEGVRDESKTEKPARWTLAAIVTWPRRTWRWARRKPYLAAAAVSLTVGLLALIILPIALRNLPSNDDPSDSSRPSANSSTPTSTCTTCSSSTTAASSTSTSSSTPTSTATVAQCKDSSKWTSDVSYMGVVNSGSKAWPYKLLASSDATACCMECYTEFTGGCQGWSYLPWDNTPVPCSIIYGWNSTDGVSSACPEGKAQMQLSQNSSRQGSFGDAGPCGTVA